VKGLKLYVNLFLQRAVKCMGTYNECRIFFSRHLDIKCIKNRGIMTFSVVVGLVLCMVFLENDGVYADTKCPRIVSLDDPFSDFDDIMTEEEKRQALHDDLKRKLAADKPACAPNASASKNTPSGSQQQGGQQQGGQQQGGQQQGGQQQGSQQQGAQQQGSQQQGGQQNADGNGGNYTSPWNEQSEPVANSRFEPLDPRSASSSQPKLGSKASTKAQVKSQAAPNVSGADKQSGTPADQQHGDCYEDIANRYNTKNNGTYGSFGNTGTRQNILNSNGQRQSNAPDSAKTISANDAVIKALEERLAKEKDPARKKQIQQEIDRLRK
jgi:hypothetical protein